MHKVSSDIIRYCLKHKIGTIVIGVNKDWKQNSHIGKTNNQNFVSIPFATLRWMITYKAKNVGINVIEQEESYTSKASSLDSDFIPVYGDETIIPIFTGKRVKRGLYRSSEGLFLNADINGSINILRKYFTKCNEKWLFHNSVRALVNVPCQRVKPFAQAPSLRWV
jgi:putative transposase